jgi:ABC-type lipoprotein release transport system permease subunit
VVSLLAGCYPAVVLSGFKPALVIKNALSHQPSGGLLLRKGLITFQFVITQVLIIATLVVVSQNHYFRTQSLGYNQQAVLTVDVPEPDPQRIETLRNSLSQYPEIQEVSFSMNAPSATSNKWWNFFWHASDPQEGKLTEVKPVDEQYLALYDIKLLAGDSLRKGDSGILVNEAFLKEIGMTDPQEAIQEVVTIGGQAVTIKGVVQDFHTLSLHQKINPLMLVYMEDKFQLASIRLRMAEAQQAIAIVEQQWKEAFPQYYFSYQFLDDDLASWYEKERSTSRLLSLFAGIAIFISCLGLYGLISFITTQKTKEVGIRKVLGATVLHIVYLFTKDFVGLVAIAFVIATPLGYYFMQQWLADFTYKIDLSWWIFAVAALSGIVIAVITISFQSIKAALANPVDSLRNE